MMQFNRENRNIKSLYQRIMRNCCLLYGVSVNTFGVMESLSIMAAFFKLQRATMKNKFILSKISWLQNIKLTQAIMNALVDGPFFVPDAVCGSVYA